MADDPSRTLIELLEIVRKLRGPDGCAWDREQTVETLRPYMLEEAYEVADAVEKGDWDMLRNELGDLLLHVVMSAEICDESDRFSLSDVIEAISAKLVRRHPHVFAEGCNLTPSEVEKQWEAIKSREKKDEGFFDSIPGGMPALQTAWRVQQRASEVGFDWPDPSGARDKVQEELAEFEEALETGDTGAQREELGDVLFSIVNYCRLMGFEPEAALRRSNRKFMLRFAKMECILKQSAITLDRADLDQMEDAWQKAKVTDLSVDE